MQIADYIAGFTGQTISELFPALVELRQDEVGMISITQWDKSLGAQPSADDIAAALAAGPSKAELVAYANAHQWALATGGYTVTIGGEPRTFATDDTSRGLIDGKALRMQQTGAPASLRWQFGPTSFVTISLGEFVAVATEIADFVQATFDAAAVVVAAIEAGTITTTAQIDDATWPPNVAS